MNAHHSSNRRSFIAALTLGMVSGCSGHPQLPEEALQQRAQAFWDARKINDNITAYAFEAASKTGEVSLQNYLKRGGGIEYRSIQIKDVKLLDANSGEVTLDMSYAIPIIGFSTPISTTIRDAWRKIDGQWYHLDPPKNTPTTTTPSTPSTPTDPASK